jgi:hypothetical protein|tara:strand:- start:216 stop:557 length:342 start_codon:yes stop_codon:yes gene_type:complete
MRGAERTREIKSDMFSSAMGARNIFARQVRFCAHFDAVHVQNNVVCKGPACQSDAARADMQNVNGTDDLSRWAKDRHWPSLSLQMGGDVSGKKGFELFIQNQSFRFYVVDIEG